MSEIAFKNRCQCDRAWGIGECDRFLVMDVGAIVLVQLESAIVFVMDVGAIVLVGLESAIAFAIDVGAIVLGELESAIACFFYGILKSDRFPKPKCDRYSFLIKSSLF